MFDWVLNTLIFVSTKIEMSKPETKRDFTLNKIPVNILTFDDVIDIFFESVYTEGCQDLKGPKVKTNNWRTSSLNQKAKT